jgi:hypothetical protein
MHGWLAVARPLVVEPLHEHLFVAAEVARSAGGAGMLIRRLI